MMSTAAEPPTVEVPAVDPQEPAKRTWTATELLRLTPEERDVILAQMAAEAEALYRDNPELTDFEAFGPRDLFTESADDETGPR